MRQGHKTFLVWIMLIFAFVVVWQFLNSQRPDRPSAALLDLRAGRRPAPGEVQGRVGDHDQEEQRERRVPRPVGQRRELRHHRYHQRQAVRPAGQGQAELRGRQGERERLLAADPRDLAADAGPGRPLLLLHAPAAGRRRQGDELRQVQGQAALREPEQGHLRRRRRHRGGQGRGRGDHRLPQGPEEVHPARRPHPQGRPDDGPARAPARRCWRAPSPARRACRSSPSRARTSSRCSSASAPAACATCSSRARRTPPASSSSTRSTPSAATAAPAWAAVTTSASRR